MKTNLSICTMIAILTFTPSAEAQRPGEGRGGPGGGRRGGPDLGFNAGNQNIQNQQFANGVANQNMPSVAELAQAMITNFDADGSGGLELAELQNALIALRSMMQSCNNYQTQELANQQQTAAFQNQFSGAAFGQANQVSGGNALRPSGRGANAGVRGFRGGRGAQ